MPDATEFLQANGLVEAPSLKPKGQPGRPKYIPPADFAEALSRLSPPHGAFVRARLSGASLEAAYQSAFPAANVATARTNGHRLNKSKHVAAALRLGASTLGKELQAATLYDLQAAHRELDQNIREAAAANQYNAVASLLREKLKMFKLVENRDTAIAQAGFVFKIEGLGDVAVVEAKPIDASDANENNA